MVEMVLEAPISGCNHHCDQNDDYEMMEVSLRCFMAAAYLVASHATLRRATTRHFSRV